MSGQFQVCSREIRPDGKAIDRLHDATQSSLKDAKRLVRQRARAHFHELIADHAFLSAIPERRLPILPANSIVSAATFDKQFVSGYTMQYGQPNAKAGFDDENGNIEIVQLVPMKGWFSSYLEPRIRVFYFIVQLDAEKGTTMADMPPAPTVAPSAVEPTTTPATEAPATISTAEGVIPTPPPAPPAVAHTDISNQLPPAVIAELQEVLQTRQHALSASVTLPSEAMSPAAAAQASKEENAAEIQ